jgi:hypothetical protein
MADKPFESRGMRFLLEVRNREASQIVELESYGSPHLDKKTRALIDLVLHTVGRASAACARPHGPPRRASRDEVIDAILAAQPLA